MHVQFSAFGEFFFFLCQCELSDQNFLFVYNLREQSCSRKFEHIHEFLSFISQFSVIWQKTQRWIIKHNMYGIV